MAEPMLLDLAWAADFLAAASEAGISTSAAVRVIAPWLKSPVGEKFSRYAASLALGATAETAWRENQVSLVDELAAARSFGQLLSDGDSEGIASALGLRTFANQWRADVAMAELERAKRAGIAVVGPLGLCFLPAFVLVSVVPVVAASFHQVLA